jgi:3-oxoacyl-[acyl-carrier protein] reductase
MVLEDKNILVTGGANGLGAAIVNKLLLAKARVIVLDKDNDALRLIPSSQKVSKVYCDLSSTGSTVEAIEKCIVDSVEIHGLVNNAGLIFSKPLVNVCAPERRHSFDDWLKVVDINLSKPFLIGSYISEHMVIKRIKGVIVNISSICATGNAGQSAYSATKAGLEALTKVWAAELGPLGIRCVAVAPGFIESPSTKTAVSSKVLAEVISRTPLKRLGSQDEIADIVVTIFENNFINGAIYSVDGGLRL